MRRRHVPGPQEAHPPRFDRGRQLPASWETRRPFQRLREHQKPPPENGQTFTLPTGSAPNWSSTRKFRKIRHDAKRPLIRPEQPTAPQEVDRRRLRTFRTPKHRVPRRTSNDGLQPHPPRPTPRDNFGLTSAAHPGRRLGTLVAPVDANQPTDGAARRRTSFSASSATISEPVGPRRPGFDHRHPLGTPFACSKLKKCARTILTAKRPLIAFPTYSISNFLFKSASKTSRESQTAPKEPSAVPHG